MCGPWEVMGISVHEREKRREITPHIQTTPPQGHLMLKRGDAGRENPPEATAGTATETVIDGDRNGLNHRSISQDTHQS